jgi:hypothetical protein
LNPTARDSLASRLGITVKFTHNLKSPQSESGSLSRLGNAFEPAGQRPSPSHGSGPSESRTRSPRCTGTGGKPELPVTFTVTVLPSHGISRLTRSACHKTRRLVTHTSRNRASRPSGWPAGWVYGAEKIRSYDRDGRHCRHLVVAAAGLRVSPPAAARPGADTLRAQRT